MSARSRRHLSASTVRFKPASSALPATAAVVALMAAPHAAAQVDRLSTEPTEYQVMLAAPASLISAAIAQGMRVIDIDVLPGPVFDAVLVRNQGAYFNADAECYFGVSELQLNAEMAGRRIVDIEAYAQGGTTLFAAALVGNEGDDAVPGWGWIYNQSSSGLVDDWVGAGGLVPIAAQSYSVASGPAGQRYLGVAVVGAGALDSLTQWQYTSTEIATYAILNPEAQLASLNYGGMNAQNQPMFDVVWNWYSGPRVSAPIADFASALSSGEIIPWCTVRGYRPVDIERYTDELGSTKFMVVAVDNRSEVEKRLSEVFGAGAFCLKQVNGPLLAQLNSQASVESAGALTIAHAARMVQRCAANPFDSLDLDTLLYNADTQNPSECPNGTAAGPVNESVRAVLTRMLSVGDNNAANLIATECGGVLEITDWLDANGLGAVNLFHAIGCECGFFQNSASPRSLCDLYEKIAANAFFSQSWEDELWSTMPNGNGGSALFATMINTEAAALGTALTPTEIADFKSNFRYRRKAGTHVCSGDEFGAAAGLVRIPFKSGPSAIVFREYTGSVMIGERAAGTTGAVTGAWPELFREQIREALASWANACTPPQISDQPDQIVAAEGSNASFSVTVSSTGSTTYSWRRNGVVVANGGGYSGANTATLAITGVDFSMVGNYTCQVSNGCGTVTSTQAALFVVPAPCPEDLSGDGTVDASDLSQLLLAWGSTNAAADIDGDGTVGATDLSRLLLAWGGCS